MMMPTLVYRDRLDERFNSKAADAPGHTCRRLRDVEVLMRVTPFGDSPRISQPVQSHLVTQNCFPATFHNGSRKAST